MSLTIIDFHITIENRRTGLIIFTFTGLGNADILAMSILVFLIYFLFSRLFILGPILNMSFLHVRVTIF